tara:strand:- start:184 stop:570 length:387 start_codon:yes stop_codon:yes gene_type:complete
MTFNIKAHTDYDAEHPEQVTFYFGSSDDYGPGHCILEIGKWLADNKIASSVFSFTGTNKCTMLIPSEEARVLIRLTYEMYIEPPEPDEWVAYTGFLPGTLQQKQILGRRSGSVENPCCEISVGDTTKK